MGEVIGSLPAASVGFDPTMRQLINEAVFERLWSAGRWVHHSIEQL